MKKMVIAFVTFTSLMIIGLILMAVEMSKAPTMPDNTIPAEEEYRYQGFEFPTAEPTAEVTAVPTAEPTPVIVEMQAPYDTISLDWIYQEYLECECKLYGLNFWMMLALMESESSFRKDAVSSDGMNIGFFQINQINWNRMSTQYGLDVKDPYDNIDCGVLIFKELKEKYPDDVAFQIMAYKAGEAGAARLREQGVTLDCVYTILDRAIEMYQEAKEYDVHG